MNNRWLNSCLLTTIRWAWTGRWQVSCRLEKNCVQWDSATHVSHCTSKNPNEWLWTHMLSQFIDSPYNIYIYIFIYIDPFPHTSSSLCTASFELGGKQSALIFPSQESERKCKKAQEGRAQEGETRILFVWFIRFLPGILLMFEPSMLRSVCIFLYPPFRFGVFYIYISVFFLFSMNAYFYLFFVVDGCILSMIYVNRRKSKLEKYLQKINLFILKR